MIDRPHDLPVARQANALGLARSRVYYQPQPVSEADLALMRRMDELHLELRPRRRMSFTVTRCRYPWQLNPMAAFLL